MKTKITFEFASVQEAQDFLAKQGAAETFEAPTAVKVVDTGAIPSINKCVKADLVALCQSKGIVVSSSMTKAELHGLLSGISIAPAPMADVPPVIETAPVVPVATLTPVEAAPIVDNTPVGPDHPLIAEFKEAYNKAMTLGIPKDDIGALVTKQLQAVGHPGVQLGKLPAHVVSEFIKGFTNDVALKMNAPTQAAPTNGGFI